MTEISEEVQAQYYADSTAKHYDKNSRAFGFSAFQLMMVVTALVVTAAVSFLGGMLYTHSTEAAYSDEFLAFWEAWNIVEEDYYKTPPDKQARANGAIQGMMQTLNDPYSMFLPPVEAEENREFFAGVFGGIGAVVGQNEADEVYIIRVMKGNPADKAGMLDGDIIRAVDSNSVEGKTVDEVVALIKGDIGTKVKVTIYRPAAEQTLDFTITRDEIERLVVSSAMIDEVGYVYLADFSAVAADQVKTEVDALLEQGAIGIIFDLRGNGGGLLDQATQISDLFLDDGLIMSERNRADKLDEYFSQSGDSGEKIPLVILIDGGTASASEIVAGALQDRDRAILIGQTTYGKAVVQQVHMLTGGGELRVTTSGWYTPDEQEITGVGLTPNILIEGDQFDADGNDRYLEAAKVYLYEQLGRPLPAEQAATTIFGG